MEFITYVEINYMIAIEQRPEVEKCGSYTICEIMLFQSRHW